MRGLKYNLYPETQEALKSVENHALVLETVDTICAALRGKGFSPVQAEAMLDLAKSKLMTDSKLV